MHTYYIIYCIPVCTYIILKRVCFYTYVYIFTYTKTYVIIKMITLESSIYKVHMHDVSNVHVYSTTLLNVQLYSRASIGKYFSFRIEISQGILVLFVRHHTLISGADTLVTGSKILFCSQDVFVVWHGVFELCFIGTFHAKLHLSIFVAFGKFFSAIRFTAKTNHFLAFKFDCKESRGTFTLGCEWGDKPVMLVTFKSGSSGSSGLIKSSTFSAVIPR